MTLVQILIKRVEDLSKWIGDSLQLRGFKAGGTTGQVPVKNSSGDFDWDWGTVEGISAWDDLTGTVSWIPFNTSPAGVPVGEGILSWNATEGVLDLQLASGSGVTLQIGSAESVETCMNLTGSAIAEGKMVYVSGSTGGILKVALADSGSDTTANATIGMVTQSGGIAHGSSGYVAVRGKVRGINTNSFNEGDTLYLTTSGGYSATKPTKTTAPVHSGRIGYVAKKAGAGAGTIFVDPAIGSEMADLHDVASAAPSDGQVLRFVSSTNLYTPATLTYSDVGAQAAIINTLTIARQWTGSEQPQIDLPSNDGLFSLQFPADGSGAFVFRVGGGTVAFTSEIPTLASLGGVPTTRTINGHALSADITVSKSDVGLGSVENTALSTWAGTTNLTTAGALTVTSLTTTGTVQGARFNIAGNVSAAAWTTNGLRFYGTPGTLTDTTSSGTVAAAYTNKLGGNTIAASNSTTFTAYCSLYVSDPVAGSNVTITNKYAIGCDSLLVAGSFTVSNSSVTLDATSRTNLLAALLATSTGISLLQASDVAAALAVLNIAPRTNGTPTLGAWTDAGGGVYTCNNSGASNLVLPVSGVVAGAIYILSFTIDSRSAGSISAYVGRSTTNVTVATALSGDSTNPTTYNYVVAGTGAQVSSIIIQTSASGFNGQISKVRLVRIY